MSLLTSACAHRGRTPVGPGDWEVAAYRAWLTNDRGEARRFRMLLAAGLPNRFHAEIVGPVGGVQVTIDGGGERLCVAVNRDRTAYVGRTDRDTLDRVFGIPMSLAEMVDALFEGTPGQSVRVYRSPAAAGGLPAELRLEGDAASLRLERRGRRKRRLAGPDLGTGRPPPGFDTAPIDELAGLLDTELAATNAEHR